MPLSAEQYSSVSAYELLAEAARGRVGVDHRFLHALLDEPERTMKDVARFAAEDRAGDRLDMDEDLVLIARYLRPPELLPFLIELVDDYSDDLPDMLVETVCGYGAAALEPLLRLYEDSDRGQSTEIPFVVSSLGVKDARIDKLLDELAVADPEEGRFCREIYEEVGQGVPEPEEFDIWAEYPERSHPPFQMMPPIERMEFLDSDSAELRQAAAASFFQVGELDKPVVNRLVDLAEGDPDAPTRGAAWRSLAVEAEDERLCRKMLDRLHAADTLPVEKAGLVVALAPYVKSGQIEKSVWELAGNAETRAAAVEAMWRSGDSAAYGDLVKRMLEDKNPAVREQAVIAVGYLRLTVVLGRIKEMFTDPDLRPAALMAYTMATPAEVTPGRVTGLFRKVEELAGGLAPEEGDLVRLALNNRLAMAGHGPMFGEPEEV